MNESDYKNEPKTDGATNEESAKKAEKQWGSIARTLILLCFSALLLSFTAYSIISPNDFVIGGIAGVAIILERTVKIPQSVSVICINAPLILFVFFKVKKRFALLSLINVILQSVFLAVMEHSGIPRLNFGDQHIFAALAGGIGVGLSVALAFKAGGSTGGIDIVASLVQKKFPTTSVAWMIFILNCMVIGASFFVYRNPGDALAIQLLPIIKAICEAYVESKVNDSITNGFHSATEFRVITDKPEELSYAIISKVGRGVTGITATGMYTNTPHTMLVCVVNKRQVATFKKVVKETDPKSFTVMSKVTQVFGLGFFSGEDE